MTDDPQAQEMLAELADSTASALVAFAQAIRPAADAGGADDLARARLGRRQQEIASVAGLDTEAGMSTSEVAREIDYDAANTHTALYALAARGIAEGFHDGDHTRWRLTPRYRSANPYLAIAQLVVAGEWTTFDDISLGGLGETRNPSTHAGSAGGSRADTSSSGRSYPREPKGPARMTTTPKNLNAAIRPPTVALPALERQISPTGTPSIDARTADLRGVKRYASGTTRFCDAATVAMTRRLARCSHQR